MKDLDMAVFSFAGGRIELVTVQIELCGSSMLNVV